MDMKHTVMIYASPELIRQEGALTEADVLWTVDFNRDLDMFFNKRKYKHDFDQFKTGVGRLRVTFDYDNKHSMEDNLAFVEAIAAKHIVANSGLNAFGFTDDKMSIRRDQLHIVFSQADAAPLIERNLGDSGFFGQKGVLAAKSAPAAGYLYGATTEVATDIAWVSPYLEPNAEFDMHDRIVENDVRLNDYVYTSMGYMIIDYRTVEEFMSLPVTLYEQEVLKKVYTRPFEAVKEIVNKAKDVIDKDNRYLDKIKSKFGDDALLIDNNEDKAWLPIIPLKNAENDFYLVLGMSRHCSPLRLQEMHSHGYGKDIPQRLSDEELQEASQYRKEKYGR
ncbi:hypothetical protein BZG80_11640 [Salinivibrio sp. MA440]|uniref:hypothetical protein n=1 Tax=Salinivibrio sp. MA440 TaxID=1909456 RepID=UPI0009889598|nr:hypothetical protein [Salinivibrio sp. MA440]OOF02812.1 hypothetical protein BZG80_11640 [Salinivibrio sp. MA440]